MQERGEVEVFWTVQNGKRWSIALSEQDAWSSVKSCATDDDDSHAWSVERTTESVSVVRGVTVFAEREVWKLRDEGGIESVHAGIQAPHVAWDCPNCGRLHTTDLCNDLECQSALLTSPQIWFCESGRGIVLVEW